MPEGAIFILRKDIGVGGWSRKWQFSLTLCTYVVKMSQVVGWVVQKSFKISLRNIKMTLSATKPTQQIESMCPANLHNDW